MYYFTDFLYEYPLLAFLQACFMIGMMVDVYRRGSEQWWFYVIVFFPVIGAWAYFFAVFVPRFDWKHPFWERKTSVEELRYRAQSSPTFANEFNLGHRLVELGRFEEAIAPLEAARKREPNHSPVCYHLAKCLFETGATTEALTLVRHIVDKEPRWEDYAAWRLLVEIQEEMKEDDAALESARQLVKLSPRLQHKVVLANQLARQDQDGEARIVLENALQEQQFVNGPVRKMNRKWVREAKRLLGELSPR